MKNDALVRIYTRPLFDLAVDHRQLEDIAAELETLAAFFAAVPMFSEYLESPNVTRSEKLELLKKGFDRPWSAFFGNYLDLVLCKGRQEILPFAWKAFRQYWDEYRSRLDVKVISAIALTDDQQQKLTDKLSKKTGKYIILNYELDPKVLGGIRLQIGHQLLDATIAGKLEAMKEELLKS
ncbi:MAG: ATP synthase F1 subunit delta [bacterium]|nr:ATP synthase F1 subunit delta [bacterium]